MSEPTPEEKIRIELGKIDPKCWLCATVVVPTRVAYGPNICLDCLPAYRQRSFLFVRASQAEIDEMFPVSRPLETSKLEKEENGRI